MARWRMTLVVPVSLEFADAFQNDLAWSADGRALAVVGCAFLLEAVAESHIWVGQANGTKVRHDWRPIQYRARRLMSPDTGLHLDDGDWADAMLEHLERGRDLLLEQMDVLR
jgi:hypothetical protein